MVMPSRLQIYRIPKCKLKLCIARLALTPSTVATFPKTVRHSRAFRVLLLRKHSVVSAKLAPLLDGNRVTVEGTMRQSNSEYRSSSFLCFTQSTPQLDGMNTGPSGCELLRSDPFLASLTPHPAILQYTRLRHTVLFSNLTSCGRRLVKRGSESSSSSLRFLRLGSLGLVSLRRKGLIPSRVILPKLSRQLNYGEFSMDCIRRMEGVLLS